MLILCLLDKYPIPPQALLLEGVEDVNIVMLLFAILFIIL